MSFLNRRKQQTWTSPTGIKFKLKSNSVLSGFKHTGDIFDNYERPGDTFYDFGISGRSIPLEVIFFGIDHDTESERFETALKEIGDSVLQLPYGNEIKVNVITVRRSYSIVDRVNQTIFLIQFHEIVEQAFPEIEGSAKSRLLGLISTFKDSLASNFANGLNIRNIFEKNAIGATIFSYVDKISLVAGPVIKESRDAIALMTNISTSIKTNIELLTSDPSTIASQLAILVGVPNTFPDLIGPLRKGEIRNIVSLSTSVSNVKDILEYSEIIVSNSSISPFLEDSLITNEKKNDIYSAALIGGATISSLAEGLVSSTFKTKSDVFNAIQRLEATYLSYRDFLNDMQNVYEGSSSIGSQYIQTGDLSVPINDIVQQTTGALVDISFELQREFIFIVKNDTTMLNIVSKYYPKSFAQDEENGVQDTLDSFSDLNRLTNDEILLIRRGREITVLI